MVLGRQHAMADHAPDRRGTDSQSCGRFVDRHLTTLAAFSFAVRCNVLVVTQGADTHACPAIATASRLPRAVQNGGNRFRAEWLAKLSGAAVDFQLKTMAGGFGAWFAGVLGHPVTLPPPLTWI